MRKLSQHEMKIIVGGLAPKNCKTDSDCGLNEKCECLPGLPCVCGNTLSSSCTSNSDCGNGEQCVTVAGSTNKTCEVVPV